MKVFGALFLLLLSSCCGFSQVTPTGKILAETAADWGTLPFADGTCAVNNITWNRAAGGKSFSQSVFVEQIAGEEAVGWRWHSPWSIIPNVVSQPQIVCGNKPWDAKTRPHGAFPFHPGAQRRIANFEVKLQATGIYNMAFSLWGVRKLPATREDISHEIMIWTKAEGLPPAGKEVGSVKVNGNLFTVFVEEHQRDASGKNTNTWMYVAFVPEKPVMEGPLEVSAFLDYLVQTGRMSKEQWITSLEFGNEVAYGDGLAEIRGFRLRTGGPELPSRR